jgi:hypothetical protein
VSRDGHITVWDAAHLSPVIDHAVSIEPEAWAAQLAAEAAQQAAAEVAAAEEALRKRREARGEDDSSDTEEASAMAAAAAMAVEAAHGVMQRPLTRDGTHGIASEDHALQAAASAAPRLPPRKKLSCVLFASNTHVLLTGDAGGRVDVYRISGLMPSVDSADVAGGVGVAAEGSEEHSSQLLALDKVLSTAVSE